MDLPNQNSGIRVVEHMATRIPLAWVVLVVIVGVFAFFGYYIIKASNSPRILVNEDDRRLRALIMGSEPLPSRPHIQPTLSIDANPQPYQDTDGHTMMDGEELHRPNGGVQQNVQMYAAEESSAPVMTTRQRAPVAKPMPVPVGMTEDDMRLPEPLQRTPPATHYDNPEAADPLNRVGFMDAQFGSNLRHPEQMIEHRAKPGVGRIVSSGLGSEQSSPGPHNASGYSPEMLQNGADFMSGVGAFDGAEMNSAFSMI